VIALVHLVWGPLGATPLQRFVRSYRRFGAGAPHQLIVLFNGVDQAQMPALARELDGVEYRPLVLPRAVQDLTAYAQAARRLEHERVCFVNSHSVILAEGWLAELDRGLDQPHAGIVGTSGSWGSIASYLRFSLGLGGYYRRVFGDRRETMATLDAIAAAHEAPSGTAKRTIPVFSYAAAVLGQSYGFGPYPAHHIRTTGFMIERELLARLHLPPLRSKNDAFRLESGRRSITAQVRRLGLEAFVVGRDGVAYGAEKWDASRTFWQGDQENLAIADKQTAGYQRGSAAQREVLSRYAWGERAQPT
jgi:hypothetical protein